MSKFYATGTVTKKNKETGETSFANVLIPLTETTRVGAVNQASQIAKRDKIKLDGVFVAGGRFRK